MKIKVSVTIGIPAYNEEQNIANLLESILKQEARSFKLIKIIVASDASTDETEKIVRDFSKRYKFIQLLPSKKREGKASRLNQIYKLNKSDILITIDADTVLGNDDTIEEVVRVMRENSLVKIASIRQRPVQGINFINKISKASFSLLVESAYLLNDGNNIHSLQGSFVALRKDFVKNFSYPKNIIADQGYLYLTTTNKNKNSFILLKNSYLLFRTTSTFKDYRNVANRAIFEDKNNLEKYFGKSTYAAYRIPKKIRLIALIRRLLIDPFYTTLAIFFDIFVRLFPYKGRSSLNGIWEILKSTKLAISVNKTSYENK